MPLAPESLSLRTAWRKVLKLKTGRPFENYGNFLSFARRSGVLENLHGRYYLSQKDFSEMYSYLKSRETGYSRIKAHHILGIRPANFDKLKRREGIREARFGNAEPIFFKEDIHRILAKRLWVNPQEHLHFSLLADTEEKVASALCTLDDLSENSLLMRSLRCITRYPITKANVSQIRIVANFIKDSSFPGNERYRRKALEMLADFYGSAKGKKHITLKQARQTHSQFKQVAASISKLRHDAGIHGFEANTNMAPPELTAAVQRRIESASKKLRGADAVSLSRLSDLFRRQMVRESDALRVGNIASVIDTSAGVHQPSLEAMVDLIKNFHSTVGPIAKSKNEVLLPELEQLHEDALYIRTRMPKLRD